MLVCKSGIVEIVCVCVCERERGREDEGEVLKRKKIKRGIDLLEEIKKKILSYGQKRKTVALLSFGS